MSSYIDTDDLKATLGIGNTDFADDDIDRAAAAASGIVDSICGRKFALALQTVTRYYQADDATMLRIDDLVELTTVKIDRDNDGTYEETLTEGTDVRVGPPNAPLDDRPYSWLEAVNGTRLDTSGGYVEVTGRFGWPTVPTEVVQATGIIASKLLRRSREAPFAILLGDGSATRLGRSDPEVRALLDPFIVKPAIGSPRLG